jgi:hypothetical protein
MATFIKGMTDQLGPMQLYRPDYQFLTQVYGTKQAQYDRGFDMVRSLYNSVLNSSLTNGDNQTFRQEAFKKLQGALKSVSNVDLSNQTNVMRAQGLIDPISQDQDLAYDMAVTKFHQSQKQKMEQYKNSTDPKMRAMYNDYSKMDIAFAEEDLRNAKRGDGSVQKVQPREFVPFDDTMEYLRKAAKEQGLEISQAAPDQGGYIIKRVNGIGAVPAFTDWARATMGNRFDRQFQVMGRVAAESEIRNEMSTSKISRDEAIQKVAQKMLPVVNEKVATEGINADKELKKIDDEIALYEKKYPNGFPPSLPNVRQDYQDLIKKREDHKTNLDNSQSEVAKMQQEGPQYVASNIYSIYSQEAKDNTAKVFGSTYAQAKQSVEYKPDTTWATKFRVASQERMNAQNLRFKYENLEFQRGKHADDMALKYAVAKGKGLLPSEEFIGQGLGEIQYGSDLVTEAMGKNREKLHNNIFNAENGLALLVLNEDPTKFATLQGALSKIGKVANGVSTKLTNEEWAGLKSYMTAVGMDPKQVLANGIRQKNANNILDMMAGATYNVSSEKMALYTKMHKRSDAQKFLPAFQNASREFKVAYSERENLNKNMLRLSKEVVDENGNVKEMYKGAKIKGVLATGGYELDLSGVTNPAAKERLQSLVTAEFANRSRPVTNGYLFKKLDGAEAEAIAKNPYSITAVKSDGTVVDRELLKNLNASDIAELFGDQANVFFDGKNAQVQLNISQKTAITEKLKIKGAGTMTLTIPYGTIRSNPALTRFQQYTQRNTVSSQSLGDFEEFMNDPNARVKGSSYHENFGINYDIVSTTDSYGRPRLLINYKYLNPQTNKYETSSEMLDYSPRDVNSLLKANEQLQKTIDSYVQKSVAYELNQQ